MNNMYKIGIGVLALAVLSGIAGADVKITSNVTSSRTGGPNGSSQRTSSFVAYYKGDNLRIENSNGKVTIYSASANKIYRVDTAAKTYSIMPLPPTPNGNPPGNNDTFQFESTGQSSSIAGQSAMQYQLTETGPAGPPPGRHGGPGFGANGPSAGADGDGLQPPSANQAGGPPKASVKGTFTLSDAVKFDSAAKSAIALTLGDVFGLRGPLARPLSDKLLTLQEIPLSANVTVTLPTAPDGTLPTVTTTATATAVATDSLDDSLFTIPTGYQQVQPQGPPSGGSDEHGDRGPGGHGGGPGDHSDRGPGDQGGGNGAPPPTE